MPPIVSILIPCYNAERYVGDAVESALAQTHPNVEVIVVDDGSTDGSVGVLESFGDRIRFEAGPNRGGCAARNRALALSRGEYIQFLDADDMLEPSKIERQLPLLLADQADIALCKIGLIWPLPRPRGPEKKPHPVPEGDPLLYLARFPIQTAAPLHPREWIERVGGFNEKLRRGQEYDLHLRVGALNPRLAMVDEILVWVRMHDGERVSRRHSDAREVLGAMMGLYEQIESEQSWTPARKDWVARQLFTAGKVACAGGAVEEGLRAQRLALQLAPSADHGDRLLSRTWRRVVGLERSERWSRTWRWLRGHASPRRIDRCTNVQN